MFIVQVIQDQASYYRKLSSELSSEAAITRELTNATNEAKKLSEAIRIKSEQVRALEESSKKEYRDVRKLRHLSFKSAAATLAGKKKELIAKEEAKYQLAFENEQRSKRDLDHLQTSYNAAITREDELKRQKTHFEETRHQFDSLLDQIFASEDDNAVFPSEPQIRAEIRNYREQRRLAKRDKGRFKETEKALSTAITETKKVIRLLDTVVNYVPFEIFGGPVIDEEQIAYIDASKRRIWDIQRLLNLARTVLPEIPHPQTLDVVTNNSLLTTQIGLNYVDIAWKAKTIQCFSMLATAYRNMQNSLTWIRQYCDYTAGAVARLDEALENTKERLKRERCRIMDSVLAGHIDSAGASSSAVNDEPPPPVYEAPPGISNREEDMPSIPANLSPSTASLSNFPLSDHSPLMPAAALPNGDSSAPPHPVTPLLVDATSPSNSDMGINNHASANQFLKPQPYISHNVNNPFQ